MFFTLKGEGVVFAMGKWPPSKLEIAFRFHLRESMQSPRVPNKDFAELIRAGNPVALDEGDFQVLSGCWRTVLLVKLQLS